LTIVVKNKEHYYRWFVPRQARDRPRVAMLFANGCQVRTGDLTNRFENNIEKRRCQEMVWEFCLEVEGGMPRKILARLGLTG